MHLTNNSIAKYSTKFDSSAIEGNMWAGHQFKDYLSQSFSSVDPDLFTNVILPQIKKGVVNSILASKPQVTHRENAHEMFGYDFMVDTDFNVWLIEVNSSPSMEYSTVSRAKLKYST